MVPEDTEAPPTTTQMLRLVSTSRSLSSHPTGVFSGSLRRLLLGSLRSDAAITILRTTRQQTTTMVCDHPLVGVWKRLWEEDPLNSGVFDKETTVFWVQSSSQVYIDLRIPSATAAKEPNPLALAGIHPDPQHVQELAKRKSFAGRMTYESKDTTEGIAAKEDPELAKYLDSLFTCRWQRAIDFQPPSGSDDVGVCCLDPDDPNLLRETGEDGSYAELWQRQRPIQSSLSLELVSENGQLRTGYWVVLDDFFAYTVGRPALPKEFTSGRTLSDLVEADGSRCDYLGSYVTVMGGQSPVIEHSNLPMLVDCRLFGDGVQSCSTIVKTDDGQLQQTLKDGTVRVWKVVRGDLSQLLAL